MRILVVEDEKGIAEFIQQGLEEEGFKVLVHHQAEHALVYLKNNSADLILLDWMLPKMSGIKFCESFRQHDSKTPIIFITARGSVQDTVAGLKAGANDYIKKPFDFEELLERIKTQLRDKTQQVLRIEDVRIDVAKREVLQNNQLVSLTNREYDLLYFLLKHRGVLCTRNDIIEQVWDIHFDYDTGVIDVFINSIRKKLGHSTESSFIKTKRGQGYLIP
ncbi:MAG: response regulator transcription factor [Flavobacteriaceae bacterium]|nr:response regulator transcription factor [Flavobacteriaceae bacterium]